MARKTVTQEVGFETECDGLAQEVEPVLAYAPFETSCDGLDANQFAQTTEDIARAAAVDAATVAILDTTLPTDPAAYEAKRFEAFKEDMYRLQIKHRYWLHFPGGAQVFDGDLFSRVKRQMYAAQAVEKLEKA
jgi:hypothetical protein